MTNHEREQLETGAGDIQPGIQETGVRSRRNFFELVLDPRTLQALMACGAGVLVTGLVVWLWSIGVFENPKVAATCLGIANAAVVVGGISLVRFTRYQTAGKAVTMLGCLVMPLNLWFYDAQGLITLDQGGHLWVPAVFCCLVYAVVARVLADSKFVFAIVAGVTMTGLLLLADQHVARFWEVLSPSALMVVIGMICIHAERAFAPGDGPFSREKFGKAFFQAGHIVLASGLMLLLGGRLAGWFYDPLFAELGWFVKPAVSTQTNLKFFALLLAMGGAYSYIYSQLVVKSEGRYVASSVLTLLWSAVILIDLLNIPFTMSLLALLLAAAALGLNLASNSRNLSVPEKFRDAASGVQRVLESSTLIVAGLHLVVGVLGLVMYGRVRVELFHEAFPFEFDLMYLAAMLLAAISCAVSALAAERRELQSRLTTHAQAAAVFAMFFTAGLLTIAGMEFSLIMLLAEMTVPLALAGWSLISKNVGRQRALALAAEVATALLLLAGVASALGVTALAPVASPHLWLMLLFTAATVCFGMTSVSTNLHSSPVFAVACFSGAVWQLLLLWGVSQYVLIYAVTIVGVASVVMGRAVDGANRVSNRVVQCFQYCGWGGVTFSGVAAVMLSLARVLVSEAEWSLVGLLVVQAGASGIAALLTNNSAWRRQLLVLLTVETVVALLTVNALSPLTFVQKAELGVTLLGLAMVALGYYGWYRETDRQDNMVSFNLSLGSLLCAGPIVVGLLHQRFGDPSHPWGWEMFHEVGVLAIGLLLLGSGLLCRIRWSTLVGSSALLLYVVSLLGLIGLPEQLQSTAVYMMVGGGVFFGIAVLLSVYRDRLLELPNKVREGEGVFQVLKWR